MLLYWSECSLDEVGAAMKAVVQPLTLSLLLSGFCLPAYATNGYFMHSFGVKAQGNAGTATAHFQDALSIASNPAGLSWVNNQFNLGATLFSPDRSAEIKGNAAGANGQYDGNARRYFVIPEFAYRHAINDQVALGIALYGNGGMNTGYKSNPFAAFGNQGSAGVNLSQVFVSPAVSWQYTAHQSIGVATNFLYQRFEAKGLNGFAGFSRDPEHLSNQGADSAAGIGVRVGWAGKFLDQRLSLGASYASKIKADRFAEYQGLFADQGNFDVPENYALGVAYKVTPQLTLAADVQRILYADLISVGNRFDINRLQQGERFGDRQGPGFGWDNINVYKLAVNYQVHPKLLLRAGYSHSDQPVPASQSFLNILAPAVVQDHASIGATWEIDAHQAWSVAYTHAFEKDLKGNGSIPTAFGGGEANLKMRQDILGLAYAYQY